MAQGSWARKVSRRSFLTSLAGAIGGLGLVGCGTNGSPDPTASATVIPLPTATLAPPTPIPSPTPTPAPSASLEEMIGQMLMLGFRDSVLQPETDIWSEVSTGRLGNTVLFDVDLPSSGRSRNIQSPTQVTELCKALQTLAPAKMLIGTDEEGGFVARLSPVHGFPATLWAADVGARNDPDFTFRYASDLAATMRSVGVNLNLAPVVDLNLNPENPVIGGQRRSFSANVDVVTAQAKAFIEGHHSQGVLCCLKHFPGHGSSRADSHLGFVDVTPYWQREELAPFQRLIAAGLADAVMTAHIFNANLDSQYPATLSHATIGGVLRGELGYDGVVITDDMQMGAISERYGFEQAIELAVLAGADIIAVANNATIYDPAVGSRSFAAIRQAVTAGRISEARIEESYRRIMRLKSRFA